MLYAVALAQNWQKLIKKTGKQLANDYVTSSNSTRAALEL